MQLFVAIPSNFLSSYYSITYNRISKLMDLLYYIRVVLKRKWLIIGAALIAGVVAWYFMRNEPKSYKSVTQLSTGFTISDEIRVGDNFSLYDADTKFNNAIATFP